MASALVAVLPLLTVFVLLGVLRVKAHLAALSGLGVAIVVAVLVYGMPVQFAGLSAVQGGVFGVFPIMWIVLTALWLYQLTVTSGRFDDLRRTFDAVSDDPRVQAMLIAFCFGGLLEALAGFGAPVAITATMLIALGIAPLRAAGTVLLANTAPVAFGAVGIPITTAATLTGLPEGVIGTIAARQIFLLAAVVPLLLLLVVDGRRGVREVWPAALVTGGTFAIVQFLTATYLSVGLTNVVASLVGLGVTVLFLRVWRPAGASEARERITEAGRRERAELTGVPAAGAERPGAAGAERSGTAASAVPRQTTAPRSPARSGGVDVLDSPAPPPALTGGRVLMALFPYLLVVVAFSIAKLVAPVKHALAATDVAFGVPGLDGHVLSSSGKALGSTVYTFPWLSSPGTMLMACAIVVAVVYRVRPALALRDLGATAYKLRLSILTVASVLALAYVMNSSGQTICLGTWIAGTGALFGLLSPVLGWIGTAVTGSDTSANALFAKLQATAGAKAGLDPSVLVSANTTGGVVGKMISPQNLTIAATSAGLEGQESAILRRTLPWSAALLSSLCVVVYLMTTPVLGWIVP